MRFLVMSMQTTPPPPEATLGLFEALSAWAKTNLQQGKLEQVWGFAGLQGGGGIANVASLEDLDALMSAFPLAAFSDLTIHPLVELDQAMQNATQAVRAMMPQG